MVLPAAAVALARKTSDQLSQVRRVNMAKVARKGLRVLYEWRVMEVAFVGERAKKATQEVKGSSKLFTPPLLRPSSPSARHGQLGLGDLAFVHLCICASCHPPCIPLHVVIEMADDAC